MKDPARLAVDSLVRGGKCRADQADDLLQEAWIALATDPKCGIGNSWHDRQVIDHYLRKTVRRQWTRDTFTLPIEAAEHLTVAVDVIGWIDRKRLLARLSLPQRRAVVLLLQGYTVSEVASKMDTTPQNVKLLMREATAVLRLSILGHLATL